MEDYHTLDFTKSDWWRPLLAQTGSSIRSHLAGDVKQQVEERVTPERGPLRYSLAEEDELLKGIHPEFELAQD